MMSAYTHTPVLNHELFSQLAPCLDGPIIDATAGLGGHLANLLSLLEPRACAIACDRDPEAISELKRKFNDELTQGRLKILHSNFSNLFAQIPSYEGIISGIYADLGVSSLQLDKPERGFSFRKQARLDMRMNPNDSHSAYEIINDYSVGELTHIFKKYGEEKNAAKLARQILKHRQTRPIETTLQLSQIIEQTIATRSKKTRIHPATRCFQALRIAVNAELTELSEFLAKGFEFLKPGGRLAIISFHSLEDRIVKQFFKSLAHPDKQDAILNKLPINQTHLTPPKARILINKPITASEQEVLSNPRARSAKLRVIEKL